MAVKAVTKRELDRSAMGFRRVDNCTLPSNPSGSHSRARLHSSAIGPSLFLRSKSKASYYTTAAIVDGHGVDIDRHRGARGATRASRGDGENQTER